MILRGRPGSFGRTRIFIFKMLRVRKFIFTALQREYLFSIYYTIVENQGFNHLFIFYIVQTRLFIFIVCQARIFIYKNCQASPSESNGRPLTHTIFNRRINVLTVCIFCRTDLPFRYGTDKLKKIYP